MSIIPNPSKSLLILVGLPGSSKSTIARRLAAEMLNIGGTAAICSTDDFFVVEGIYQWNPGLLLKNHLANQEKARQSCKDGVNLVIIDNTNLKREHRKIYEDIGAEFGYTVETKVVGEFTPDFVKICAERNLHGVPLSSIIKMAKSVELPA